MSSEVGFWVKPLQIVVGGHYVHAACRLLAERKCRNQSTRRSNIRCGTNCCRNNIDAIISCCTVIVNSNYLTCTERIHELVKTVSEEEVRKLSYSTGSKCIVYKTACRRNICSNWNSSTDNINAIIVSPVSLTTTTSPTL